MQYEIFMIPGKWNTAANGMLNRFLRSQRLISVHRDFVEDKINEKWVATQS